MKFYDSISHEGRRIARDIRRLAIEGGYVFNFAKFWGGYSSIEGDQGIRGAG